MDAGNVFLLPVHYKGNLLKHAIASMIAMPALTQKARPVTPLVSELLGLLAPRLAAGSMRNLFRELRVIE